MVCEALIDCFATSYHENVPRIPYLDRGSSTTKNASKFNEVHIIAVNNLRRKKVRLFFIFMSKSRRGKSLKVHQCDHNGEHERLCRQEVRRQID